MPQLSGNEPILGLNNLPTNPQSANLQVSSSPMSKPNTILLTNLVATHCLLPFRTTKLPGFFSRDTRASFPLESLWAQFSDTWFCQPRDSSDSASRKVSKEGARPSLVVKLWSCVSVCIPSEQEPNVWELVCNLDDEGLVITTPSCHKYSTGSLINACIFTFIVANLLIAIWKPLGNRLGRKALIKGC